MSTRRTMTGERAVNDPKQHIVVEDVEFSQLFHFPKILGEIGSAFQPGRLVIGLFMVVVLMTAGQIWDASTSPTVHPAGLMSGTWSQADHEQALPVLRAGLAAYSPDSAAAFDASSDGANLQAAKVLDTMASNYWAQPAADDPEENTARALQFIRIASQVDAVRPRGVFESVVDVTTGSVMQMIRGVLLRPGPDSDFIGGAETLFCAMPVALWTNHKYFTVVYGLVLVLVLSLGGGALSRMTACQRAGHDRLTVQAAFDFGLQSWPRLIFAILMPLFLVLLFAVLMAVFGWIVMLPWVDVIGGIVYGISLLLGLAVVFLLVGYFIGFVMLIPAVASENCDAADAQQRAYAYIINGLALGYLVAGFVASNVLNATALLTGWFSNNPAMAEAGGFEIFSLSRDSDVVPLSAWHDRWLAGAISFWQTVVGCLVAGYVFAYLFGASTTIYMLMRRACDGQALDEIWLPGQTDGTYVNQE
jgi:hypothetical protein